MERVLDPLNYLRVKHGTSVCCLHMKINFGLFISVLIPKSQVHIIYVVYLTFGLTWWWICCDISKTTDTQWNQWYVLMMESLLFLVILFCMDCTTCLCILNVHYISNIPVHTGPVDGFRIINFDLFNSAFTLQKKTGCFNHWVVTLVAGDSGLFWY